MNWSRRDQQRNHDMMRAEDGETLGETRLHSYLIPEWPTVRHHFTFNHKENQWKSQCRPEYPQDHPIAVHIIISLTAPRGVRHALKSHTL